MSNMLIRVLTNPEAFSPEMLQQLMDTNQIPTMVGQPLKMKATQAKQQQAASAAMQTQQQDMMKQGQPQQPQMPPQQSQGQPQMPGAGVTQLASGLPTQMAGGGIVAFASGGGADEEDDDAVDVAADDGYMDALMQHFLSRIRGAHDDTGDEGFDGVDASVVGSDGGGGDQGGVPASSAPQPSAGIASIAPVVSASYSAASNAISTKEGNKPARTEKVSHAEQGITAPAIDPRTGRSYNVGNLRPVGFEYQGQVGKDKGGFAVFDTPEAGIAALKQDIGIKLKRGLDTPAKFISVYAPPKSKGGDNADNITAAYINNVAHALGIGPHDHIPNTPEAQQLLAKAIIKQEGSVYAPQAMASLRAGGVIGFAGPQGSLVDGVDPEFNPMNQEQALSQGDRFNSVSKLLDDIDAELATIPAPGARQQLLAQTDEGLKAKLARRAELMAQKAALTKSYQGIASTMGLDKSAQANPTASRNLARPMPVPNQLLKSQVTVPDKLPPPQETAADLEDASQKWTDMWEEPPRGEMSDIISPEKQAATPTAAPNTTKSALAEVDPFAEMTRSASDDLKQRREAATKSREQDKYLALIQAGLGMIGTQSLAGASHGIKSWQDSQKQRAKEDATTLAGDLGLTKMRMTNLARLDTIKEAALRRGDMQAYNNARLAALKEHYSDLRDKAAAGNKIAQQRLEQAHQSNLLHRAELEVKMDANFDMTQAGMGLLNQMKAQFGDDWRKNDKAMTLYMGKRQQYVMGDLAKYLSENPNALAKSYQDV